jgi:hypothetical protein
MALDIYKGRRSITMAKKAIKTVAEHKKQNAIKLPRSVSKHIRLLKSQGRTEEADNLRKTTIESRTNAE